MSYISNHKSIGIFGMGVLGKAIKSFYKNALCYDIATDFNSDKIADVCKQEWVFVCVPTPSMEDGGIDLQAISETLKTINLNKGEKTKVVIKSTVIPGTTQELQGEYNTLPMVMCPEFLTEKTSYEDFAMPDKNIIGTTNQYPRIGADLARILPSGNTLIMTSTEAEMVKYAINSYYATKVVFANELYELCEKIDINYNAVHRGLVADKRINNSHFKIFHGDNRGFGGKCLPKDVSAIVEVAKFMGIDMDLLKQVIESNKKFSSLTFEKKKEE